jgi:hypothetical protein
MWPSTSLVAALTRRGADVSKQPGVMHVRKLVYATAVLLTFVLAGSPQATARDTYVVIRISKVGDKKYCGIGKSGDLRKAAAIAERMCRSKGGGNGCAKRHKFIKNPGRKVRCRLGPR